MKFIPEEIIYRQENMVFFVRITIETEDGRKGKAIAGAFRNYIMDYFQIAGGDPITEEHKTRWLELVINDLSREIREVNEEAPYLRAYSFSQEGTHNLLRFLSGITP